MIISSFVVVMVMAILTQTLVYDVYGDVTMPDTRFTYTLTEITDVFNTLGQAGLNSWVWAHMLDFVFPLTYMFAMSFGINLELRRLPSKWSMSRFLVLFPLLGGIFDYVENTLVLTQIAAYPNLSGVVIATASAVTMLKWAFLMAGFVIIFVLIPFVVYYRLSNPESEISLD